MNMLSRLLACGAAAAMLWTATVAAEPPAPKGVWDYITYNENGHPNLSALRGMSEHQIRTLLARYRNTASPDITDMSGQSESYDFALPPEPPPRPAAASTASEPHSFKGFMRKFGSDMKTALTEKPKPQPGVDEPESWLCTVSFDGPNHTVGSGNCLPLRNPFQGTMLHPGR